MRIELLRPVPELITILIAEPSASGDGSSTIAGLITVSKPERVGATAIATFFRTGQAGLPQHVALIAVPKTDEPPPTPEALWELTQSGQARKAQSMLSRWKETAETLRIEGLSGGAHLVYAVGIWE